MRSLVMSIGVSLVLAGGCGGGQSTDTAKEPTKPVVEVSDAQPVETPEEKFARQQTDTVDKMCQRLIDCSIEDARQQLSPEKFAEMKVEELTPKAVADCTQEYDKAPMSPRQVIHIRGCLGEATECSAFNDCLSKASEQ